MVDHPSPSLAALVAPGTPEQRRRQLSVVIVNWNTSAQLLRCIAALCQPAGSPKTVRVIVVDNASTDDSFEMLRTRHPAIEVVRNTENVGYGAALNQGIRLTNTPYVLAANADTECHPYDLDRLAVWLMMHPAAAMAGPHLVGPDGSLQLSWGPAPSLTTEAIQRWWWRRREATPRQRWLWYWAKHPRPVDWVLGACCLLRRDAFEQVGGMDHGYFMYFEEVDLCTRLRHAGWEIWYVPTATVMHHGQASVRQNREAMAVAYRRSQLRYYRRFHGVWTERLLHGYLCVKFGRTTQGRRLLRSLAVPAR